jgi:hypothetical protein
MTRFKGVSGKCKIYQFDGNGPRFDKGFSIFDKCDKNLSSYSFLGDGFENVRDSFALFGSEHFAVLEYEVFGVECLVVSYVISLFLFSLSCLHISPTNATNVQTQNINQTSI